MRLPCVAFLALAMSGCSFIVGDPRGFCVAVNYALVTNSVAADGSWDEARVVPSAFMDDWNMTRIDADGTQIVMNQSAGEGRRAQALSSMVGAFFGFVGGLVF